MNLIIRPAALRDLPLCLPCIRDLFLHDEAAQAQLLDLWHKLLTEGFAMAIVAVDLDAPPESAIVGFAIGAFLTPSFVTELRQNVESITLIQRILQWHADSQQPFLNAAEIRDANTNSIDSPTLALVTLHSGVPAHLSFSEEGRLVRNLTAEFNYFGISGYRLEEYFTEAYGEAHRGWMANLGFTEVQHFRIDAVPPDMPGMENSAEAGCSVSLGSITRAQAQQNEGAPMSNLFHYRPPCFGLNAGEQEMLSFALSGLTDAEIADLLDVAVVTVRKRFLSVYEKAGTSSPELFPAGEDARPEGVRGVEKKRRLLNYLKIHLEELRPYKRQ